MRKPSDEPVKNITLREKIMGLGKSFLKKNYYNNLRDEIDALEKSRENLEETIKKAEANEKLLRVLLDNAIDGILLADVETRMITLCNRSMLSMLGYTELPENGFSVRDIHPEEFFPYIESQFMKIAEGDVKLARNIPVKRSDGSLLYVDVGGTPIDMNGRRVIVGVFRDMTEARKIAIEMGELESRLHQMQKMEAIGTLAGGVAHDFNNILAAIMGLTEISLRSAEAQSPLRRNLDRIMESCYRARDLVSQLLSISYKGERKLEPINLIPVIKDAVRLIRATIPATVSIQTFIDAELDTALADQTQISQIIMNLCTNSAQAMPGMNGEILIRLLNRYIDSQFIHTHPDLKEGWHLLIEVSDNGSGMKAEIMERIFEPFFTTRERGKGTGLGLSVIHRIVKSHGGEISVESEPGKGATFRIYIPLTSEKPAPEPAEEEMPVPAAMSVLLVDDEKIITDINTLILASMGHKALVFNGGAEALAYFRDNPRSVDLVITDMTMPGMTGLALASEIHRVRPGIPVILCTGYNEQITEAKAESSGICEILMKPFTTDELGLALKKAAATAR